MNEKKIDPRDSYSYLLATARSRSASAEAHGHSAQAHRIAGDTEDAKTYDRLAVSYREIADRYFRAAEAAPDHPDRLRSKAWGGERSR